MGGTFPRLCHDLCKREDLLCFYNYNSAVFFEFSTTPAILFLYIQFDYVN